MLSQLVRSRTFVSATAVLLAVGCSSGKGGGNGGASVAPSTSGTSPTSSSSYGTFSYVSPLSEARVHHTATLLSNGTVLIIGGQNGATTVSQTTEIFDPTTGSVSKGPSLGTARMNHAAILLPTQKVLVVGGQSDVAGQNALATTEVYDPIQGKFAAGPALSEARSCPALALYKDGNITKVLIAGGAAFVNGVPTSKKTADIYNADANTLTASSAVMAQDRFDAQALTETNGQIMIQGGYTGLGATGGPKAASSEIYDIKNALFVAVATVANRAESALCQDAAGNIFAAGGTDGSVALGSVESFNGQAWSAATALQQARQGLTGSPVSIAPTGVGAVQASALFVGGLAGGSALATCEFLGLNTQQAPSLNMARGYHTATVLQNQQIVIAGGEDGAGNILSSIEVWAAPGSTVAGAQTTSTGTSVPGGTPILPPTPTTTIGAVTIATLAPTSGNIGDPVTITGTGFDPNPANNVVKFNGVLATVTAVNVANPAAMTITTTVPTGATTGAVTVTVGGNTSAQNPIFTVNAATGPAPRILFVLPNSAGHFIPVSITGQDFGQQPIATFNGVPTISIISLGTKSLPFIGSVSELIVLVPPGATSGPLIVTANGQASNPFNFVVK